MPNDDRTLIEKGFLCFFSASEAVRVTSKVRSEKRRKKLEREAEPFISAVFDLIAGAAVEGKGRIELSLDCAIEVRDVIMNYLRACGYTIDVNSTGGAIRWHSDEETDV